MLSNKELLIILKQQVNFDRDQKVVAVNQTAGCDLLFGYPWPRESDNASAAEEILPLL
jgi:hypothetical protein